MENCEQSPGTSVLDHGKSVWCFYKDLISHLRDKTQLEYEWRLPEWVYDPILLNCPYDELTIKDYLIFHDCGKPYCRTVDDEGRHHFPDHAQVSKKTWLSVDGNSKVAQLIGMDMDIHLLKGDEVCAFAKREEATSLLLSGLSEIHSNASMFGGIESTSFKIKRKQINRRGKAILKELNSFSPYNA